jgi:hypothetical protein
LCIHDRGGHLAVVLDSQRSSADPAAGGHTHSIGAAAIGLDKCEQALVGLGDVDSQEEAAEQSDPNAHNLARAQMVVQGADAL